MLKYRLGYLAWLLLVIALYFFENNAGTLAVLIMSVAIPAISVAGAAHVSKRIKCSIELPGKIYKDVNPMPEAEITSSNDSEKQKEKDFQYIVRIFGTGFWNYFPVNLRLCFENRMTGGIKMQDVRCGIREETVHLPDLHCGNINPEIEKSYISDWFHLARLNFHVSVSHRLSVVPKLMHTDIEKYVFEEDGAEMAQGGAAVNNHIKSRDRDLVKEYAPGDPLKMIHWKLSAKMDRIMVRDHLAKLDSRVFLFLDTRISSAADDALPAENARITKKPDNYFFENIEKCVGNMMSFSYGLISIDIRHNVCWYDHRKDLLIWMEINQDSDFTKMQEAVLDSLLTVNDRGIYEMFRARYPYVDVGRAVIFDADLRTAF